METVLDTKENKYLWFSFFEESETSGKKINIVYYHDAIYDHETGGTGFIKINKISKLNELGGHYYFRFYVISENKVDFVYLKHGRPIYAKKQFKLETSKEKEVRDHNLYDGWFGWDETLNCMSSIHSTLSSDKLKKQAYLNVINNGFELLKDCEYD